MGKCSQVRKVPKCLWFEPRAGPQGDARVSTLFSKRPQFLSFQLVLFPSLPLTFLISPSSLSREGPWGRGAGGGEGVQQGTRDGRKAEGRGEVTGPRGGRRGGGGQCHAQTHRTLVVGPGSLMTPRPQKRFSSLPIGTDPRLANLTAPLCFRPSQEDDRWK